MCGRINVSDNEGVRILLAMLGMEVWPSRDPRFNVAPSQSLDVVTWQDDRPSHESMKWGLLPNWAKPGTFSAPLINARSETIREKPSFKNLITNNRVVIPINGFYEWRREGKIKTPYFVSPSATSAMFVGALYQPDNETKQSHVAVVTVESNDKMNEIHHRMPVILSPENALTWIQASDQNKIDALMVPASNDTLEIKEVSDYVNSARNEGPDCVSAKRMNDLFD